MLACSLNRSIVCLDIAVRADGNVCAIVLAWFSLLIRFHTAVVQLGTHAPTVVFKLALVMPQGDRYSNKSAFITCLHNCTSSMKSVLSQQFLVFQVALVSIDALLHTRIVIVL